MRKAEDSYVNLSKAELLAEIARLNQRIMSFENCEDDQLSFRLKLFIPLSGDAYSSCHHYANQYLLDSLQYSHQELEQFHDNCFSKIVEENDRFLVCKIIRHMSCNESDKIYRVLFRLVCKNNDKIWIYWSCRVSEWHYRGKPKTITFCGIVIDQHTYDRQQFIPCINQCKHSALIARARSLDKELWDVLLLMYQGKSYNEMAGELHISIEGVRSRQKRLLVKLELACINDLKIFIFESSLLY